MNYEEGHNRLILTRHNNNNQNKMCAFRVCLQVCAVQLPGREGWADESISGRSLDELAAEFVSENRSLFFDASENDGADDGSPSCCLPSVFFGHAEGAWFAYAVAAHLEGLRGSPDVADAGGRGRVLSLVVSNFPAPSAPLASRPWKTAGGSLSGRELKDELDMRGAPRRLVEDPLLWRKFEGSLREDTALVRTYIHDAGDGGVDSIVTELSCPIRYFMSRKDALVGPSSGRLELVEMWKQHSKHSSLSVDIFYGDHYYICDRGAVGRAVCAALRQHMEELCATIEICFGDS